jgi:hypothetical protein
MERPYLEKAADILTCARAKGFGVSPRQIAEWHRRGLLEKPKQMHIRGGTETRYPCGTCHQLQVLLHLMSKHKRNFEMIGWLMAMGGYRVHQSYWRKPLEAYIAEWECVRENFAIESDDCEIELSDEFLDGIEAADWSKAKAGWIKRSRRHLQQDDFSAMMSLLTNVAIGTFERNTGSEESQAIDRKVTEQTFGLAAPSKKKKNYFSFEGKKIPADEFLEKLESIGSHFKHPSLFQLVYSLPDADVLSILLVGNRLIYGTLDMINNQSSGGKLGEVANSVFESPQPKVLAGIAFLAGVMFGGASCHTSQAQ